MKHDLPFLRSIVREFEVDGEILAASPYGTGHINDTYLVETGNGRGKTPYILQRINHDVFKNPPLLMENIARVTGHLRAKLSQLPGSAPERETLTVIPARDGAAYFRDASGNYWRMYIFISNACTYDVCETPELACAAARAFGRFQALLADLKGKKLHETIPWFHHTPRRLKTMNEAVASDRYNRCRDVKREIEFCQARQGLASALTDLLESGRIPERIAHNDSKINNVMIDRADGRGICVIDLDTVMNGSSLYDFGDMVRTAARTVAEDERDLARVVVNLPLFEALARGYLESARSFLTPLEVENMTIAAQVITFTIGIRFLADYLMGDVYFKTHRPGHNLDRARVQFKLLASMEERDGEMRSIVAKYA